MLYYESGKIRFGSVYVKIPDGVYIETQPEMSYEFGFVLVSPDERFQITIQCDNEKKDALKYLNSVTQGVGYKHLDKPEKIQVNGLHGWQLRYGDIGDRSIYYEVVLDIPKTEEARILDIYVRIEHPTDRESVINSRIVQELLSGITIA